MPSSPPSVPPNDALGRPPSRWTAFALAALLGLAICGAGLGLYRSEATAFRQGRAAELDALAALKVDQVIQWRSEKVAAAESLAADASYQMQELRLAATRSQPPSAQVEAWLAGMQRAGDVVGVGLVNAAGEFQVSAGAGIAEGHTPTRIRGALVIAEATGEAWFSDFQEDRIGMHVDVIAPVRLAGELAGGIFLRIDPQRRLFPMLLQWPVPSSLSAETVLARADGDGARVLNRLRHLPGSAMRLRVGPREAGAEALLAAVRGERRSGAAPDYRGVSSIYATRPVPNSTWAVLVKVDAAEAFSPLRERFLWTLATALALAASAALGVGHWWRSRREAARRERDALARRVEFLSRWGNDMVFLVDEELRIVEANDRAEALLGYRRDELLRLTLHDLRDPETPDDLSLRASTQLAAGWGHWETRYRRKDGSTFPVDVAVQVERSGGRAWFHGIVRDITERKRSEEALRASETRFRAAFDGVPVGMVLLDRAGRVVETNRAMQAMLDRPEVELRGAAYRDLVHPDDVERSEERLARLRAGNASLEDAACRYQRRDGAWVQAQVRACALAGPDGAPEYALAMVEDVSDRRRMEAQLRLADRMASMGTLAAGMAHEINNPLAFILANLEYSIRELRRDGTKQDVIAALEEAREGGTRVREIVRDLKTFSRADDEGREPLEVNRVLRSALSLASNEIRARARLEVSLGEVPRVLGSEHRLGQVLLNLLINAAQAIPEGRPEAHVVRAATALHEDGRVVIEIADDGGGIPPALRARIFDPFFTTKPVGVGTGLGLSICHGIVVAMGGEIALDTEVGRGSTFRVLLPPAPAGAAERPAPRPPAPTRRAKILVIDDEPLVCRALQRILSPPHDVRVQGSGHGALALLDHEDGWDLVICDLMMPDLSGMELFGTVAERRPHLAERFVFLTGGAFTPSAREFLERVPNERVEKPFEAAALRELVARLLRARPHAGA
ncbi:MAG TPA: PAS domain S-box protein [Anaeromyxobacter sp.]|nr:PAS domain S-box protein [Anaeromyxobacter sp.]